MVTRRTYEKKEATMPKVARSGKSFTELMGRLDTATFGRMMMKSGLPDPEARELCQSFKDLRT